MNATIFRSVVTSATRGICVGFMLMLFTFATHAQDYGKTRPLIEAKPDRFGVDMASGGYINKSPFVLSAPGASRLAFQSSFNSRKQTFNLNFTLSDSTYVPAYSYGDTERHIRLNIGGGDKLFRCNGMTCVPTLEDDGSSLTKETANRFVYRDREGRYIRSAIKLLPLSQHLAITMNLILVTQRDISAKQVSQLSNIQTAKN